MPGGLELFMTGHPAQRKVLAWLAALLLQHRPGPAPCCKRLLSLGTQKETSMHRCSVGFSSTSNQALDLQQPPCTARPATAGCPPSRQTTGSST